MRPTTTTPLTPEERKLLADLEKDIKDGQRRSITALREIRKLRLYREDYRTFDDYVAERWKHTRQWATQNIAWLRRQELLEELAGKEFGKSPYQLSVAEAQVLSPLEPLETDDEATEDLLSQLFVEAVIEAQAEADAAGKIRTVEMLKAAVEKRKRYVANRRVYGHDLTLGESEQIARLSGVQDEQVKKMLSSARQGEGNDSLNSDDRLKQLVDQTLEGQRKSETQSSHARKTTPSKEQQERKERSTAPDENKATEAVEDDPLTDDSDTSPTEMFDVKLSGQLIALYGEKLCLPANEVGGLFDQMAESFASGRFSNGGIEIARLKTEP